MTQQSPDKPRYNPKTYARAGYVLVFLTFGVFGGWASTAPLDSAVIAQGTVGVESNRKLVQHLEGGIVDEILVREASIVEEGDVLVQINAVSALSNVAVLQNRHRAARATEARLLAERTLSEEIDFPQDLLELDSDMVRMVIADQRQIFDDRQMILASQTDILEGRILQLGQEETGLRSQGDAFERRLAVLGEQLQRLRGGQEQGVVQTNLLSEKESDMIEVEANLARVMTEHAKIGSSVSEARLQIVQVQQEYSERANAELREIRSELSEITEQLIVARNVLERTQVRAPVSGAVQNMQIHTAGGVISPGTVLMEVVPQDDDLIINAQINPIDIDNVHRGQYTEVRFPSFSGRSTPVLEGMVETVSHDVITPDNPNQPPYFLARVTVPDTNVPEHVRTRITAGMPVDVIMATGERTLLNYLVAPLEDAIRKSLREE